MATKEERISVRASKQDKQVLQRAAELRQIPLTQFMLSASREAAQQTLSAHNRFILSNDQMKRFLTALDRPPRRIKQLRKLFAKPSIFER